MLVPETVLAIDWNDFYAFCHRQGILGVVYGGIEKTGKGNVTIPRELLYRWVAMADKITKKNDLLNRRVAQVTSFFAKHGFRSCILKGQANATMYPRPELRSGGDIDIWVEGRDEDIIRFVLQYSPEAHYSLHHVVFPMFQDVSVEVHYRPIFLDNKRLDRRLQRHIDMIQDEQFGHRIALHDGTEVSSLTDSFNVVYQLLHMWHHFFSTRNNLKQLIDYFYLLKSCHGEGQKEDCRALIDELGLLKYAKGIMWIEHEVLGIEEDYLPVEPDEEVGQLILAETLSYGIKRKKSSWATLLFGRLSKNRHLFRYFPSAVLNNPEHLLWHQWWKLKMKYRLKKAKSANPS